MEWDREALGRLDKVHPQMREMAKSRIEEYARKQGYHRITVGVMEERYASWGDEGGEVLFNPELQWDEEARSRVLRAPPFVRSSLIREIEAHALNRGVSRITGEVIDEAREKWKDFDTFHESFNLGNKDEES